VRTALVVWYHLVSIPLGLYSMAAIGVVLGMKYNPEGAAEKWAVRIFTCLMLLGVGLLLRHLTGLAETISAWIDRRRGAGRAFRAALAILLPPVFFAMVIYGVVLLSIRLGING
jgi:hypothetical protein